MAVAANGGKRRQRGFGKEPHTSRRVLYKGARTSTRLSPDLRGAEAAIIAPTIGASQV